MKKSNKKEVKNKIMKVKLTPSSLFAFFVQTVFFTIFFLECTSALEVTFVFFKYICATISVLILMSKNQFLSLKSITLLFYLFFLNYASILQYFNNVVFWGADPNVHTLERYIFTDLLINIYMCFFFIAYRYPIISDIRIFNLKIERYSLIKSSGFYLTIINLTSLIVLLYFIGFENFFLRSLNTNKDIESSLMHIIQIVVRALPLCVNCYLLFFRQRYSKSLLILNFLLFALIYTPFSMPRWQLGSSYIAIIWLFFYKNTFISSRKVFVSCFVLFGFIFNLLNYGRNIHKFSDININFMSAASSNVLLQMDFDAYQMVVNAINYTFDQGITYGRQLLGAVLFFIPRQIWENKPIGSGHLVAGNFHFDHDNLSMPIMGEAYLNYGLLGVILFGLFIGSLCMRIDKKYENLISSDGSNFLVIFYPVLIGLFLFFNRGPMLACLSYTIGIFFAFIFVIIVLHLVCLLHRNKF